MFLRINIFLHGSVLPIVNKKAAISITADNPPLAVTNSRALRRAVETSEPSNAFCVLSFGIISVVDIKFVGYQSQNTTPPLTLIEAILARDSTLTPISLRT